VWLSTAAVLAVALVAMASPAAMASRRYSISSGTWNVRSCLATCGTVDTISGSIPNLVCQTSGPAVTVSGFGTSTVYDMIRTPAGVLGYISDLGVLQTPYAQFSPYLPRCTAGAGPATEATTSSGYGWIASCSFSVWTGREWSCWAAGLRYLFLPGTAS
jgi:hypothetical protein